MAKHKSSDTRVIEFSRPRAIESLTANKHRLEKLEATPQECSALTERLDLKSLSGLKADIKLFRSKDGNTIKVEGSIEADVVQSCIISLKDVPSHLSICFDTCFSDGKETSSDDTSFGIEVEEEFNSPVSNGVIDLGELVAQYISLELEPYPRAEGVIFEAKSTESEETSEKHNPFKVLEVLKKD